MKHAVLAAAFILSLAGVCRAQTGYQLEPGGTWRAIGTGQTSPDRTLMDRSRRSIAEGKTDRVVSELTKWLEKEDRTKNPWYPEALLLRGNARLASGDEFNCLYDYERVIKEFPGSETFVDALEKEYEVADLYLNGRRKKMFGVRVESGVPVASEIILRINERLPGSKLAEKSLLRLADYYYAQRDLEMAGETYDVFLTLYPRSEYRSRALQRRVFASIAGYKGPRYDATGLEEAKYQIEDFQREFPLDAQRLGMSDALTVRLEESQAEQLLVTARWYLNRGDTPAAKLTLSRLIRTYPGTGAAKEGLDTFLKNGWALPGAETKPEATPAAQEPQK